jgi:hypothetical protein
MRISPVRFEEVVGMEESSTYRAIVRRGEIAGERRILLKVGEVKFGPPDAEARAALERITEVQELDELAVRFVKANTWQEWLSPRPRTRRRNTG